MRRVAPTILTILISTLLLTPSGALAEREQAPDRINVAFSAGVFLPAGKFGDAATSGPSYSVGGWYRLTEYVAPAFFFHHSFLKTERQNSGAKKGIDFYDVTGGFRLYPISEDYPLRPFGMLLAGWAHYSIGPDQVAPGLISPDRDDRDDAIFFSGGGVEYMPHPSFTFGAEFRYAVSTSDTDRKGEKDLNGVYVAGGFTVLF